MWRTCFFFNDTATTEIYTLSLHDALPILNAPANLENGSPGVAYNRRNKLSFPAPDDADGRSESSDCGGRGRGSAGRSEEHTSELQSRQYLVCRLLLEKKKPLQTRLVPAPS